MARSPAARRERRATPSPAPTPEPPHRRRTPWAALSIVALGLLVQANGLHGPFVFDDVPSIVDSPNVRSLTPLSSALWAPPGSGASGRPLVALSLALNYRLGGIEPFGYRLANVLVHVACALALFALVRRTLVLAGRRYATGAAWSAGLLFALHPLATSTLQHVVYRNEALMALFYLLTVLCAARGIAARPGETHAGRWQILAVACCLLGVLSKEPMVSAPLLVLLYDRALVSGSLRAAWRRHRALYLGLCATWIPLALLVASGDRGASVGFAHAELTALDYLRTQAGAILHYLRLVIWPHPLVLDYAGWPVARELPAWLPQGALVLLLLALGLFGTLRKALWGLPALGVFAVLAPSSSVVPLGGMLVGEHRAYLPLALLASLAAGAVAALLTRLAAAGRIPAGTPRRIGAGLTIAAALGLGAATLARNADYASAVAIYADTVAKRPDNYRALNSLGTALKAEGRLAEARDAYERSLELFADYGLALNNLGNLLLAEGRPTDALPYLARAIETDAERADYHFNYAAALLQAGRRPEAMAHYQRAATLQPRRAEFRYGLGYALELDGRLDAAAREYRAAARLKPEWRLPRARLQAIGQ